MRWIILGALLGLLIVYPPLRTLAVATASKPVVIGFTAGVLARPVISRRIRRWTR